jgi:hypothetical protein
MSQSKSKEHLHFGSLEEQASRTTAAGGGVSLHYHAFDFVSLL